MVYVNVAALEKHHRIDLMIGAAMAEFEVNTIEIYADRGRSWLKELPTIERALCDLWGLSQITPLQNLSYN